MHTLTPKKILITAARFPVALDMARLLHNAGHEVYTAESLKLPLCSFSKSVRQSFHVPSPRSHPEKFVQGIAKIADAKKIDVIIPLHEEILYLAQRRDLLPCHCQLFAPPFDLLKELHNKWLFTKKVIEAGMEAPKTVLIKSQEDLKKLDRSSAYALKACYSRTSCSVMKLSPHAPLPQLNFEPHNPWIAQEWLEGKAFCTYSICRDGVVQAHATYPVQQTANKHGCIVYTACAHSPILKWVQKFAKHHNITGQIAFDFIVTHDKKVLAIECNPRATNGSLLFQAKDRLDRAFLQHVPFLIAPELGYKKQLGIAMLFYGWQRNSCPNNNAKLFFNTLLNAKDTVLDWKDLVPFLVQPISMSEVWMNSLRSGLPIPTYFTSDTEWNGNYMRELQN